MTFSPEDENNAHSLTCELWKHIFLFVILVETENNCKNVSKYRKSFWFFVGCIKGGAEKKVGEWEKGVECLSKK